MRRPNQPAMTNASANIDRKIRCQLPSSRSPLPVAGANTGTMMKIIMVSDMTRAISRPAKRSRTIAMASTRTAAAPMPWIARATSSTVESVGDQRERGADAVDHQAEHHHRAAPDGVGDRPEYDLHGREADQEHRDDQLQVVLVGDAERRLDRRERRQQVVHRQRDQRHHQGDDQDEFVEGRRGRAALRRGRGGLGHGAGLSGRPETIRPTAVRRQPRVHALPFARGCV